MKVGLVADSHGEVDERVVMMMSRCELVVHSGDIGHAGVLSILQEACPNLVAVKGNNDTCGRWPEHDRDRLNQLNYEEIVPLPGGDLVVVHGHRAGPPVTRHRRLRSAFPDARAIVYGHSHRWVEDIRLVPWVLNPGACGRSRTFGGSSCQVLIAEPRRWSVTTHQFSLGGRGGRRPG